MRFILDSTDGGKLYLYYFKIFDIIFQNRNPGSFGRRPQAFPPHPFALLEDLNINLYVDKTSLR
jgi:hypothetical protein